MQNSGYTTERAAPHERVVWRVLQELNHRGYETWELPVDGDRPDCRMKSGYVEVKTGVPSLVVKVGSFQTYKHIETVEGEQVWIVWVGTMTWPVDRWRVVTVNEYESEIVGGKREPTGRGSHTPWYLSRATGSPFVSVFPSRLTV